ncbi:hypothetical protein [Candidatus Villigracilis saccharophilus]|uniref:hypothetical protein n=1 Tax=Candidatus Villigracilis saccharophilus TaxID=3140684 RepID=UPI003136DF54|nr:hypothetical protein [Anaerolineales bacterium]
MTTYNTNLAAEFYVLSMLHRLGADAALTLGNKKAVDIIVASENRTITTVEVKGLAKAYDWPADNIHNFLDSQHFYVLVCFEGKITDPLFPPSVWIIPSEKLSPFIKKYETRIVISRAKIKADGQQFLHKWSLITG